MHIYEYGKDEIPKADCVLALGFFDGVHIAHRALIARAELEAKRRGCALGVFTFSPGDGAKSASNRIYSMERRLGIIASLGVDFCVSAKFEDIRDMSAEEFCTVVLSDTIGCRACVVGYNFRFGRGASAGTRELEEIAAKLGIDAVICPKAELFGIPVSSSAIREYLKAGDMKSARAMLGEYYATSGVVVHGRGIGGKRLSTPTANLSHDESTLLPRLGVYAAAAEIDGKLYPAAANLGVCPTYGGLRAHTEAYIIGFDGDLYGKKIKLSFLSFLRDEVRFENEEMLKMQIELDKNATIKEFNYRND